MFLRKVCGASVFVHTLPVTVRNFTAMHREDGKA